MAVYSLALWHIPLLLVGATLSNELFLRLPVRSKALQLTRTLNQVFRVLLSPRISDHWKERVILAYANRLMLCSILLPIFLILTLLPLSISIWLSSDSLEHAVSLSIAPDFLIFITLFSAVYFTTRRHRGV